MTRTQLENKGFQNIINESGASVMELKIDNENIIRTWGHNDKGEVMGFYNYNKETDTYSQESPLFN